MWLADQWNDYEVIDCSKGEKLERWGDYLLVRPDPQVIWDTPKKEKGWRKMNGHYHRSSKGGGEWEFFQLPKEWTIQYSLPINKKLTFHLKPFSFKHTGLFPEQAANWNWFSQLIADAVSKGRQVKVLNLFAYTGGATLAAAAAGASVTHVDASKGMVTWAKENAISSGLKDAPIRWLVDDCVKFVEREIRRGPVPEYEVTEDKQSLVLSLDGISVEFDKGTEVLTFKDANKRIILQEKVGGRFMKVSSVQNEPTYQVEQRFVSPKDEYIYGTGQFQDGYLNIRGVTRRLTQVNTQISIPFILSSKGYGLLWNNYGLTDFNPADQFVELTPANASGEAVTVNTTGTSGNVRETRQTYSFTASVDVPRSGSYSLLLDVGQRMARKYYLVIDGQKIVDVNNLWLPPTTSAIRCPTSSNKE